MVSALTASPLSDEIQAAMDYSGWMDYYAYDYADIYNNSLLFLGKDELQYFGGTFSGVLYTLIFILSLVGNSFLLWALLVREDLRKTTTLFLLQLAVSDLLLTLTLPFWAVYYLHHWVFGTPGCHLLFFLHYLGLYSYMAFLVAVTVDRYLVVVHAVRMLRLRLPSRLCVALSSASLWLVCVAASVPEAVHSETEEYEDKTLCQAVRQPLHLERLGCAMQVSLFFFLPFALILFCYARIWATVSKCRSARRAQAVRLIFCVVLGFFACWTPYNVVVLLGALQRLGCPGLKGTKAAERLVHALYVCRALAYCHCFLNPALHIFGSERFRSYLSICRHSNRGEERLTLSTQQSVQRGSTARQ